MLENLKETCVMQYKPVISVVKSLSSGKIDERIQKIILVELNTSDALTILSMFS